MDPVTNADIFLRLFLAVVMGGAVGFERESEHMAAGLRTHILVSLGSCLAILVGITSLGWGMRLRGSPKD